jgi:hypothetical protein
LVEEIGLALRQAPFDVQQAGELFLRVAAERAIREALARLGEAGKGATIKVAGRDGERLPSASFLGARVAPDLVVDVPSSGRVAVSLTLLRRDAAPVTAALAGALLLASSPSYGAVVALLLDRRVGNPFGEPDEPAQAAGNKAAPALRATEETVVERLWRHHQVWVEVRRQDPFGWG